MSDTLRDDDGISNPSRNPHLTELVDQAIARQPNRRVLLKAGLGAAAIPFLGGLAACGGGGGGAAPEAPTPGTPAERMLGFIGIPTSGGDAIVVPAGYVATAFLPWGTPLSDTAPSFQADASNTAADQEQQVGDNHDGMAFFGFNAAGNAFGDRSDEGVLVFNNEYINPEYFFQPDTDPTNWMLPFTPEKARKGQAAHGVTIAHVRRNSSGEIEFVRNSPYNRRIHGNTPITLQGPAAGDALLRTTADPTGTRALGTLNNCGNGRTPWGTYLTCEENFNGYFGWTDGAFVRNTLEGRYGISQNGSGYQWHTVDPRFDISANRNEPNRFGYIVEIDPFAPASEPVKRTALGRFKHENAELVIAPDGKVVVYMGCDEVNEYVYKFVSSGTFDASNPTSAANRNLLSDGTLYVARFDAGATAGDRMGTGVWIPLTLGQNGLDAGNGWTSQADIAVRTRQAADRVGATMMDRPEWVSANPTQPGEVMITLTNNSRRGTAPASANPVDGTGVAGQARPATDEANPRAANAWGHIVRWNETGGDATALTFDWDIFLLAGQPSNAGTPSAPSDNITADNLFNSPDGLAFDSFGRLWIQTDGNFSNTGNFAGNGNNQMLAADPETREVRRFLVGPSGCEITGITWTPDRRTMFVNVQHPGELGSHPNRPAGYTDNDIARDPTAFSTWPTAGVRPRSAVVVVRRTDGGVVGG
ncbi:MAG: PhoX family phosphatase [Hydrogenophaga sp.]|nr:PhoX family phosphatase [Hydrogenophaga sp.]